MTDCTSMAQSHHGSPVEFSGLASKVYVNGAFSLRQIAMSAYLCSILTSLRAQTSKLWRVFAIPVLADQLKGDCPMHHCASVA